MEEAAALGIKPLEFWEMTPFELSSYTKGYLRKVKEENKEKITIAYIIAALSRTKKLPKLENLIESEKPKKEMTSKEMLEKIKILNIAFGGEEIKHQ